MHIVDTPEPTTPGDEPVLHIVDGDRGADRGGAGGAAGVTAEAYKTNVTTLTERIAIRLAADGAEHPVAAAVTLALRGMTRLEPDAFAESLQVAPADLRALEAGTIALADLPKPLWHLMHEHGLEPVLLVDLDHQLRDG